MALALDNVGYTVERRRRGGAQPLFAGVTLRLEPGRSAAIMGPSGVGKSTLLALALGLLQPISGAVTVAGSALAGMRGTARARFRGQHVGVVFQSAELIPELTARDNVVLPALLARVDRAAARDRADALLDRVGLSDRSDELAAVLSGGERQRAAVARALINEPALILADEPTGSLDEALRDDVADLVFGVPRATGAALLVVTHDRGVARRADEGYALGATGLTPLEW